MLSEKELVEGCIKGNRNAQRDFYEYYSKKVFITCLRYSKCQDEAEDILQECFIKVFKNLKNFRGDSKLETWIKRIAINTALNYQRSKLYLFPMVDVEHVKNEFEEDFTLSNYHFKELLKMIQELPSGCQVIFNLYAIEGYNHKEISEMLGVSVGTSKSQYARAKSLLKEMLGEEQKVSYGRV
ncbi:MAG: RNA polymerase sigma factor [Bacteroidota bacterium]